MASEEVHSAIGATTGAVGGATLGWVIADVLCTGGLGTLCAVLGGAAIGGSEGAKDKTASDNARTGFTAAGRASGWWAS